MHIFCLFQLEQIEINLTILLRLNSFDQKRKQKVCQKKWKTTQDDLGSCRDPVTSACTTTTITTSRTRPSWRLRDPPNLRWSRMKPESGTIFSAGKDSKETWFGEIRSPVLSTSWSGNLRPVRPASGESEPRPLDQKPLSGKRPSDPD